MWKGRGLGPNRPSISLTYSTSETRRHTVRVAGSSPAASSRRTKSSVLKKAPSARRWTASASASASAAGSQRAALESSHAGGLLRRLPPRRVNVGPAAARLLARAGWTAPDPEQCPTGLELVERLLQPLAALPELAKRVHTRAQVAHASRSGALKGDLIGDERRRAYPF